MEMASLGHTAAQAVQRFPPLPFQPLRDGGPINFVQQPSSVALADDAVCKAQPI